VKDASGNAVGGANAYVYDTTGSYNMLGYEITGGDGSVTLYGPTATNFRVAFVVFDGRMIGSQVYNGQLNYPSAPAGNNVNIPASPGTIGLGTVALPAGGVLKGTMTKSGAAIGNSFVQVRLGGKSGAYRIQTIRTMSDGSYMISLPPGTITRLCASDSSANLPNGASPPVNVAPATGSFAYSDTVSITAGSTTTASTLAY
jgi:hypothetical protein